jgi:4,5-DOPA dioxygenase extradiol
MNNKPRILYISHGGGPLPLLGDPGHIAMVETLKKIAADIQKPSAIIVISAHWEEKIPTLTAAANPALIYDYYGFPEESYDIQYPCTGEPALAAQCYSLLKSAGIEAAQSETRGFDHGLFVPLKIMYPKADIPCVQLSLVHSLEPAEHIKIGRALGGLADEDLLIIGSGFSFHNLPAFFAPVTNESRAMNESFEQWLIETCSSERMGEDERTQRLENWEQAPFARYCHPREEHLLPLHVCYGIAQRPCSELFQAEILNRKSSMYLW